MFNQFLQSIPAEIYTYLPPVAIILASFLLGFLVERVILRMFIRMTAKTRWKGDDAAFKSLKGILFIWVVCAGTYYATVNLPLSGEMHELVRQVLTLVVIASLTILASRVSIAMVNLYSGRIKGIFASTSIFSNITKVVIFIIGFLIGLQTLGISVTPILAALGVGGLAVALALQDSLSNLFSGLHIIASRQVKPGDFIKIENGEQGVIEDITWRNTTIRSLSKYLVIMPNSKLAQAVVVNYSQTGKELTVMAEVPLSYDNDLPHVEKVTQEVAKEIMHSVPGGVPEYVPHIRFNTFETGGITMNVMMRGKQFVDQYLLKHEFLKKLHERYKREGINITAPVRPYQLITAK
jgi:small-conductance mechanosensitive channel